MPASVLGLGVPKLAPLGVRMSEELKAYMKSRTIENHRSLNAEIVVRLEESRAKESVHASRGSDTKN